MKLTFAEGAALVSGGSGGIGASVVRMLAENKVPVAQTYHRHREAAMEGIPSYPWSSAAAVDAVRVVVQAEKAVGPIRYLVACSGIAQEQAFFRLAEAQWLDVLQTNLTANIALTRAVVTSMMKAGFGRIVLMSSVSGSRGIPGHTVYAASKGGLDAFARSLSHECAGFGITVNTVAPGFIDTPMLDALPAEKKRSLAAGVPVKRLGTPDEVAWVVAFLLSEQGAYVTGQTWGVDGAVGVTARRVGITGMGVTTGYGRGVDALWSGLSSGRSAVRPHAARMGRSNWVSHPMAALPNDPSVVGQLPNAPFVAENHLEDDPDLVSIADCIQQAIADARLDYDRAHNDLGLVVTHESPALAPHVQSFFRWRELGRSWLRSKARFNPPEFLYEQQRESVYRLHSFLYVHYLSAVFGLHGFTLYNNNACASGAFAMAVAADRIRNGEAETVIVAGGDVPEDGTKYRWFGDRGLYSPTGRCRPFAAARDGLVLGSGAAAFVLSDLELARAEGRKVYAEWLGGGFTSDGWKVTIPDVAGRRYAQAIARALRSSDLRPEEVTMVAPHGVGASLLDQYEAEALASVFGRGGGDWPLLVPFKGAIGHTLGGCALVETVGALLALQHETLPAAATVDDFDPALPLGRSNRRLDARAWTLLKCVNGFGGQNGAFVLRSAAS